MRGYSCDHWKTSERRGAFPAGCKQYFFQKCLDLRCLRRFLLWESAWEAEKTLTLEGKKALNEAELLIGAKRMTEAVQKPGQMVLHEYRSEKIVEYIREHPEVP